MEDRDQRTDELLEEVAKGRPHALGDLFELHRDQLVRIVEFRMDVRLRRRIDSTDVIQEAFLDVTRKIGDYLERRDIPFFLWLRFLTLQKLAQLRRTHLHVQARSVAREIPLLTGGLPQATSAVLAAHLLGQQTSPSEAAMRAEATLKLEQALQSMDDIDREVLALRHFERMSNKEVAVLLELSETAASNRYMRALVRLRKVMEENDPQAQGD